jgi:glutathione synthase/RimK-type ligase-like ATP-grasp enzyme
MSIMVILCGLPTESPLDYISTALENLNKPFEVFCPTNLEEFYLYYEIINGKIEGEVSFSGLSVDLRDITGVYNRMVDFSLSPNYRNLDITSEKYLKLRSSTTTFLNWLSITNAKVLNHNKNMISNSSKPYQMMLIKNSGFRIPESCVTNQTEVIEKFRAVYTNVIYKSASGVRSIVKKLDGDIISSNINSCPVLFQECLVGINYRVHVIGNELFATKILSKAVDYRYATTEENCDLQAVFLPKNIEKKCINLSKNLNLPFCGIDLMKTKNNDWYCFEVNPSPGFTFYENQTKQPISKAVAKYLSNFN